MSNLKGSDKHFPFVVVIKRSTPKEGVQIVHPL